MSIARNIRRPTARTIFKESKIKPYVPLTEVTKIIWARKLAGQILNTWRSGHFDYNDILTEVWLVIDAYWSIDKRLAGRIIMARANQTLRSRWADDVNVGLRFSGRITHEKNNGTFSKRTIHRETDEEWYYPGCIDEGCNDFFDMLNNMLTMFNEADKEIVDKVIIKGVPVAKVATKFRVSPQAIYQKLKIIKKRLKVYCKNHNIVAEDFAGL